MPEQPAPRLRVELLDRRVTVDWIELIGSDITEEPRSIVFLGVQPDGDLVVVSHASLHEERSPGSGSHLPVLPIRLEAPELVLEPVALQPQAELPICEGPQVQPSLDQARREKR